MILTGRGEDVEMREDGEETELVPMLMPLAQTQVIIM